MQASDSRGSINPFGGIDWIARFKPGDHSRADPSGGGGLERPARPLRCFVA
jgi:hypothetical protein